MSLREWFEFLLGMGADAEAMAEAAELHARTVEMARNGVAPPAAEDDAQDRQRGGYTIPFEPVARSSKSVSVLPLTDWVPIPCAAERLGISTGDIKSVAERLSLNVVEYGHTSPLVHVRQVAYAFEHGRKLDVDVRVFDAWERQSVLAAEMGVSDADVSDLWHDGKLAVYKPARRLVLLNEMEVYNLFSKEE